MIELNCRSTSRARSARTTAGSSAAPTTCRTAPPTCRTAAGDGKTCRGAMARRRRSTTAFTAGHSAASGSPCWQPDRGHTWCRGEPDTKVHGDSDAAGRLIAFTLTGAQVGDHEPGPRLPAPVPPSNACLADAGYDRGGLHGFLLQRGTLPAIPTTRPENACTHLIPMHTAFATSSNACPGASKTGVESRPATISSPSTTPQPSSPPSPRDYLQSDLIQWLSFEHKVCYRRFFMSQWRRSRWDCCGRPHYPEWACPSQVEDS